MSQGQKSPHEDFIIFFLICFILGGLAWVIWHFFSLELTNALRWVRVAELNLVRLIHGDDALVYYPGVGVQKTGVWRKWLTRVPVEDISILELQVSTKVALRPLKMFFLSIMGVMAVIIIFKGPGTSYRRRMGLEGLMKEQVKSFPVIAPFINFDPRKMPVRVLGNPVPAQLPPFAEALSPEEWLAYNEVPVAGGNRVDVGRAYQALSKQLGKRWQGPQSLPLHAQGIYAACALRHVRRRKDCEDLLGQMAASWSIEKGFSPSASVSGQIRSIVRDPKLGGALQKFCDQHAYETTAMLRALARAREEGGVLAPAQFVWLRGHDRALWYPLNNLGRKSYHAEAAGALVHYTNELIAGQKIPTPRFDEVIKGFETHLKSPGARPVPPLDKKAGGAKSWKSG